LGIDVKTVRRLRKGAKPRPRRASKLDAFKPLIQELVIKKDLTATRVLREIRATCWPSKRPAGCPTRSCTTA
jgi:hypothetical protein